METVDRLRREVQELHAIECGVAHVLDDFGGGARHRRVAVVASSLVEVADRHMDDLARICAEEGWTDGGCESSEVRAWSADVEALEPAYDAAGDLRRLGLLRHAVRLKMLRYEQAQALALEAHRSTHAHVLRFALDDERTLEARIERLEQSVGVPQESR